LRKKAQRSLNKEESEIHIMRLTEFHYKLAARLRWRRGAKNIARSKERKKISKEFERTKDEGRKRKSELSNIFAILSYGGPKNIASVLLLNNSGGL